MDLIITVSTLKEPGEEMSSYGNQIGYPEVDKYEVKTNQQICFYDKDDPSNTLTFDGFRIVKLYRKNGKTDYGAIIAENLLKIGDVYNKTKKDYLYFYLENEVYFEEVINHCYLNEEQSVILSSHTFGGAIVIKVVE